jgi:hypothetical protein
MVGLPGSRKSEVEEGGSQRDDPMRGYEEVTPLTAVVRALLATAFWATVLDSARLELPWGEVTQRLPTPGRWRVCSAVPN